MTDSQKLDLILKKVDTLDVKVSDLERDMKEVKHSVIRMGIIIENEIRVNIQRVAEGHLDLYSNLNDCIQISNAIKAKQEMQDIFINMHDNKLRAL